MLELSYFINYLSRTFKFTSFLFKSEALKKSRPSLSVCLINIIIIFIIINSFYVILVQKRMITFKKANFKKSDGHTNIYKNIEWLHI